MNILYKNADFNLPIIMTTVEGQVMPEDASTVNIKVYTTDPSTYVEYTGDDLDSSSFIHIDASALSTLENGIIYYQYHATADNIAFPDGSYDISRVCQTSYYLKQNDNAPTHKTTCATAVSELVNDIGYATQNWVTEQIENAAEAGVDLTNYYTKSQIDNKFDDIDVSVDLTNYYTKSEVDQKIADISVGDVSIHVDLSDYYTKSEVNDLIPDTTDFITVSALSDYAMKTDISTFVTATDLSTAIAGIDASVDLSNYYTKSEVDQKIADISIGDVSINIDTSNFIQKANNTPVYKIWVGNESEYLALNGSFSNDTLYFVKES